MEHYFTIDVRNLTTAECVAMTSGLERAVLLVARALRANPAGRTLLHYDSSTYAATTTLDRVPAVLREPAQALLASLLPHEFLPVLVLRNPRRRCAIDALEIILVEPRVEVVCKVRVARSAVNWPPKMNETIHFMTLFEDGTLLVTGNDPGEVSLRAQAEFEAMPGAAPSDLLNRHLDRLETLRGRSPIVPVNAYDADEFHREVEARFFSYWRNRGVFTPATIEQIEQAHANWEGVDLDGPYADVIAEIRRQQTQKPRGAGPAVTLFLISFVLFAIAGSALWELDTLAMLVGILLFHEAGHFVAMKVFGYRNVQMFFLPLFGAAVSGDAQRAVSWKRAIVALAGPVPGIFIGSALGLWASWHGYAGWERFALYMVALNALNLLPMLPLDGGHVLHAVIFQRSLWADLLFRVLAGIGLLFVDAVTRVIGILVLLQCRTIYLVGCAVRRLRQAGRGRDPEGVPVMSPGAAEEIAAEISVDLSPKRRMALRDFAAQVKEAYNRINVPPPGVFASLGILGLYVGSLVLAVVLGVSIFWVDWARHPDRFAATQRAFEREDGSEWTPPDAVALSPAEKQMAVAAGLPEDLVADIRRYGENMTSYPFPVRNAAVPVTGLRLGISSEYAESALEQLRRRLRGTGCMAFRLERNYDLSPDALVALRCARGLDFVAIAGTAGTDANESNEQVMARLADLELRYGLDVIGAGGDWVEVALLRPPDDLLSLAREITEFCPDGFLPGEDNVKDLAEEIGESGRIHLSWD